MNYTIINERYDTDQLQARLKNKVAAIGGAKPAKPYYGYGNRRKSCEPL